MPIPDYQSLMLPILKFASDGEEHSGREAVEDLAGEFELTPEERKQLLPSGRQPVFENRVHWARTYLKQAGVLESTRRGYFRISERGQEILAEKPGRVDNKYLMRYPEFEEFRKRSRKKRPKSEKDTAQDGESDELTPKEAIEEAYQKIRDSLSQDLLASVQGSSPAFFERLVVKLLVRMGYGGSEKDAGTTVQSGDQGIDGIIKEDRLGLDFIYIQAKKWGDTVTRPEIQKFAGALLGKKAKKGVFITTSDFSKGARAYARDIDARLILINGTELAELMIDHDLGVSPEEPVYVLKRIDSDFFTDA